MGKDYMETFAHSVVVNYWIWLAESKASDKMAVQLVQYMDLRQAIDINPPSYHIIQIQVSQSEISIQIINL